MEMILKKTGTKKKPMERMKGTTKMLNNMLFWFRECKESS